MRKLINFLKKILFNETDRMIIQKSSTGQTKKKIKVKHHIPMIRKWLQGKEQMVTAFVVLALLIFIWFMYLIWGTWSPAKFAGGIQQYDDIELPGRNPYDKK